MVCIKKIHSLLYCLLFSSVMKVAQFWKVSFIIGSHATFFSLTSCLVPLSGAFGKIQGSLAVGFCSMAMGIMLGGFNPFLLLVYHVPGICASLYLASEHWAIRLLLPALCMALFIAHPVGSGAAVYSFFSLIPVALYFIQKKPFFWHALGSTLTAHAVGSVIWIYAAPMSSVFWLSLIPVVIIERTIFAAGMTLAYHAIKSLVRLQAPSGHAALPSEHVAE